MRIVAGGALTPSNAVAVIARATGTNQFVGATATASGWGLTADGGNVATNLQHVSILNNL